MSSCCFSWALMNYINLSMYIFGKLVNFVFHYLFNFFPLFSYLFLEIKLHNVRYLLIFFFKWWDFYYLSSNFLNFFPLDILILLLSLFSHLFYCWRGCLLWPVSHAGKVMLKILQARLQQYVNTELPDVQAGFRKGKGTRDQVANIRWIMEKTREFQKNIYFCFIDYAKAFDCVDHNKLWKILKVMGIPDHLTCLLRNL